MMTEQEIQIENEINEINARIDHTWTAIQADISRREWLRYEIAKMTHEEYNDE